MNLKIKKMQLRDRRKVAQLFEGARLYKQSLGDTVWGDEPFTSEDIDLMARDGHLYVAKLNGEIAGAFMPTPKDTHNWDEKTGDDQQALYIHFLVTAGAYRGQNVGGRMIEWACSRAREQNRSFVRLDCSEENKALCRYYEKQGFIRVGLGSLGSVVLYQKSVSHSSPSEVNDNYHCKAMCIQV